LVLVVVTAVITGPMVVHGADGLEAFPLLLLGFPCSLVLAFVGAWGLMPLGDDVSDWGLLFGLVGGGVANAGIVYRLWGRKRMNMRA
jgi:hypothetical protein